MSSRSALDKSMRTLRAWRLRFTLILVMAAGFTGCEGPTGPVGPPGPPGPSYVLGFASFQGNPVRVLTVGGGPTASVQIIRRGVGVYAVAFAGDYSRLTTADDLVVVVSPSSQQFLSSLSDLSASRLVTPSSIGLVLNSVGTAGSFVDTDFSVVLLAP
jgi:hypothetical protein